jgi:transglycosylase-like protein with SLT domain/D-alanyl-D-alanine carboxypeptidase-like protein
VSRPKSDRERGQAVLLLVGAMAAVLVGAFVLGAIARGVGVQGRDQRAADLGALAGARAMRTAYYRLFEPGTIRGRRNPRHLTRAEYLRRGRAAAMTTAHRNGVRDVAVEFPDGDEIAPVRVRVTVTDPVHVPVGGSRGRRDPSALTGDIRAVAEAELAPPGGGLAAFATGGGYSGPLSYRQNKPMRPDVALAFDRMAAAAVADGVSLTVNSAFRSDAEQAVLFARHPDPRWVARPGQSLHRNATELDLGPPGAYGWLAANATRFGFLKRYSWEPWHFGYTRNPGSVSVGFGIRGGGDGRTGRGVPSFVPARFAPMINRAAMRWSVSAALLSAQLYAESGFNPFATSSAGAQGIAQFMPGTARSYGLHDPFDPAASIDAQAHMMRDLLRRFGSVPLALAAYNAGPGAVSKCGCIPPYPETRGYVARILGLLSGAGDPGALTGLAVRLVK